MAYKWQPEFEQLLDIHFDVTFPITWNFGDDPSDGFGRKPVCTGDTLAVTLWQIDENAPDANVVELPPEAGDAIGVAHISLLGIVNSFIETCGGDVISETHADHARKIIDALRTAADRLESATPPSQP